MLDAMKRGDRVQTIGGILGNVVEVRPDKILLKVDEGNNTKVWFARTAILRVLGDEAEAK
jgi:preprotein translocase subunit YajC